MALCHFEESYEKFKYTPDVFEFSLQMIFTYLK